MDSVQERITTLHALAGADRVPVAPLDRTAVVVPMAGRDVGPRTDAVLSAFERVAPKQVLVALRADADRVGRVAARLDAFERSLLLGCNGPRVSTLLEEHEHGLDGAVGNGLGVWLALGLAARHRSSPSTTPIPPPTPQRTFRGSSPRWSTATTSRRDTTNPYGPRKQSPAGRRTVRTALTPERTPTGSSVGVGHTRHRSPIDRFREERRGDRGGWIGRWRWIDRWT